MYVGIGLPTTLPTAEGRLVIEWARRAEAGPFASLAVLDRLVYDSYEAFIALTAAAAVTKRIMLATTIVISPLRNTALLAKTAASLNTLAEGRLVLGLAVGARKDDYDIAGVDYHTRGKRLTEQLATLHMLWEQGQLSPSAMHSSPHILVGGLSDSGFARMARYADGYVHGGGPPRAFARIADKARAAWSDAGRPNKPQMWAQGYFALGDDALIAKGQHYLRDYYAFTGPFAEKITEGLLTTPQAIAQFLRGYEEAGCDILVLFPTIPDIEQLDRLAEILNGLGRYTFS